MAKTRNFGFVCGVEINLSTRSSHLYTSSLLTANPNIMVSNVFASREARVGFLRDFNNQERRDWVSLLATISNTNLSASRDKVSWALESSRLFSVKSLYAKLLRGPKVSYAMALWAARVPPRVGIFLWQAFFGPPAVSN